MPASGKTVIREAVGYFKTSEALQAAIDALMSAGFDRAELSLMATERAVEEKLGRKYRKIAELEDNAAVPRTCYVSPESIGDAEGALIGAPLYVAAVAATGAIVASGGTLAAILTGATIAGGAGGLIGTVLAKLIGDRRARHVQEQLDHGGLLLWVRTWVAEDEKRAVDIMKQHSGQDVHVHALPSATL